MASSLSNRRKRPDSPRPSFGRGLPPHPTRISERMNRSSNSHPSRASTTPMRRSPNRISSRITRRWDHTPTGELLCQSTSNSRNERFLDSISGSNYANLPRLPRVAIPSSWDNSSVVPSINKPEKDDNMATKCNTRLRCKEESEVQAPRSLIRVSNDCPICMEKLTSTSNQIIGTTVPCGHCFHWHCFKRWNRESNACPTCNLRTTNFIRIYITSEVDENVLETIEGEVSDVAKKSIKENKILKRSISKMSDHKTNLIRELSELEKELKVLQKNSPQTQFQQFQDFWKQIGNGVKYMHLCMLRGCRKVIDDVIESQDDSSINEYSINSDYEYDDTDELSDISDDDPVSTEPPHYLSLGPFQDTISLTENHLQGRIRSLSTENWWNDVDHHNSTFLSNIENNNTQVPRDASFVRIDYDGHSV